MAEGRATVEIALGPYTIRVLSDPETDVLLAEEGVEGDSDVTRQQIRLRSDLPFERRREVLVHELLHHAYHLTALPVLLEAGQEEIVVRSLAPWLATAVQVVTHD